MKRKKLPINNTRLTTKGKCAACIAHGSAVKTEQINLFGFVNFLKIDENENNTQYAIYRYVHAMQREPILLHNWIYIHTCMINILSSKNWNCMHTKMFRDKIAKNVSTPISIRIRTGFLFKWIHAYIVHTTLY